MIEDRENGHGSIIERGDQELDKLNEIFFKLADDIIENKLTDEEKQDLVKDLTPEELKNLQELLRDYKKGKQ